MPYRSLAISSRHNPVTVSCYVGLTALSLLYISGITSAISMQNLIGPTPTRIWELMLFVGGTLSIIGIQMPKRRLLQALTLEALGAFILGFELGIYCCILAFGIPTRPWASVFLFSSVAIGILGRSYVARRDRKKLRKATEEIVEKLSKPEDL